MFALADCNNFYASCERLFRPDLRTRPIVVLSNNDGCVVARSAEAKTLGIPMGAPAFMWERVFREQNVAVFSSNYTLYGDMSGRVMNTLMGLAPRVEVYSIDEAFLDLHGLRSPATLCRDIKATVQRNTGIPVSIGFGPSKTLAKLANKWAKKHPETGGVFALRPEVEALLSKLDIEDVWGIHKRKGRVLRTWGVNTVSQLRDADLQRVRKRLSIMTMQTVLELRGRPCFDFTTHPPAKKNICSSRSFGQPVRDLPRLKEAMADYTTRAAEKLRAQGSVANVVMAFLQTNAFKKGEPQYSNLAETPLLVATAFTPKLIQAAQAALKRIYLPGYAYKKVGVLLAGLEPARGRQLSLLDIADEPKMERLMAAFDGINARYGRGTAFYAAAGINQTWAMKRGSLSPAYTTRWEEMPEVKVG